MGYRSDWRIRVRGTPCNLKCWDIALASWQLLHPRTQAAINMSNMELAYTGGEAVLPPEKPAGEWTFNGTTTSMPPGISVSVLRSAGVKKLPADSVAAQLVAEANRRPIDLEEWDETIRQIRDSEFKQHEEDERIYHDEDWKCYDPWDEIIAFLIDLAHDCGCAISYARIGEDREDNDFTKASDEYNGYMVAIGMRRSFQDYE